MEPAKGWYVPFGHTREPPPPVEGQQEMDVDPPEPPPPVKQLAQARVLELLEPLFTDPAVERVAHNAKAPMLALAEADGGFWLEDVGFDTMVAAYLLGDANVSVRSLAFERLGQELVDPKTLLGTGRKAIPFSRTEAEDCAAFAAGNADMALRLAGGLAPELERTGVQEIFEADRHAAHRGTGAAWSGTGSHSTYRWLEQAGRGTGGPYRGRGTRRLRCRGPRIPGGARLSSSRRCCSSKSGCRRRARPPPAGPRTRTRWSRCGTAHPAVEAVLQWRELTKIKSTYVDTLPQQVNARTGRVHTVFSQVTAATGRLSSNDPNLQNIPVRTEIGQAVRLAFVARDCGEEPLLLSVDYSQIELRVLAHMSGDQELVRAFEQGLDIHAATASRVFKVGVDEVTAEMRRRAKVFNFGVLYGLTAFGLSQREGVPREEAEDFIKNYFAAYHAVAGWQRPCGGRGAVARVRGDAERPPPLHPGPALRAAAIAAWARSGSRSTCRSRGPPPTSSRSR